MEPLLLRVAAVFDRWDLRRLLDFSPFIPTALPNSGDWCGRHYRRRKDRFAPPQSKIAGARTDFIRRLLSHLIPENIGRTHDRCRPIMVHCGVTRTLVYSTEYHEYTSWPVSFAKNLSLHFWKCGQEARKGYGIAWGCATASSFVVPRTLLS